MRAFVPSTRNNGQIRSSVVRTFLRTIRRAHSAFRLRRGRVVRSSRLTGLVSTGARRASIGRPYLMAIAALHVLSALSLIGPKSWWPFLTVPRKARQRRGRGAAGAFAAGRNVGGSRKESVELPAAPASGRMRQAFIITEHHHRDRACPPSAPISRSR